MEEKKVYEENITEVEESRNIGTWLSLGIVWAVIFGTFVLMFVIYLDRV